MHVLCTGKTRIPSSFDAVIVGEGKPRSHVPCLGTLRQLRDDDAVVTDFSMQGLGVAYRGFLAKVLSSRLRKSTCRFIGSLHHNALLCHLGVVQE